MSVDPNDKYIIVNYHYVRDPSNEWLGIHPCSISNFENQVKWLSKNYKLGSVEDVFGAAQRGEEGTWAAITLDDGLKDQFENAFPILQKHHVPAIFFIITKTFEGFVPATHKIHILLSRVKIEDVIETFENFLKNHYFEKSDEWAIPLDRRLTLKRKLYDPIPVANFKEMMNIIPTETKEEFLSGTFASLGLNEQKLKEEFFMSKDEVRKLEEKGFEIGSHGHEHHLFDSLNDKQVETNIQESKEVLFHMLRKSLTLFSYPQSAPSRDLSQILKNEGFLYAVTTIRRGIAPGDSSFLIPRYDATDIVLQ